MSHSLTLENGSNRPALVMAGAVSLLALPSAILAVSARLDTPMMQAANQGLGQFAPGQADPRLAMAIAMRQQSQGPLFRFTPAGLATRPDRSVTVAVRVDSAAARAIVVTAPPRGNARLLPKFATLRIAPTAYNLGLLRGYQGFSTAPTSYALPGSESHKQALPDLSAYAATDTPPASESRLAPHISLVERERAGRAPRTLESGGEQNIDLGGAYHVTRNFDVTAGVRYSQDRDRLKPTNDTKSDSQAVFVGTQFRF
jgi:hypothetical protein